MTPDSHRASAPPRAGPFTRVVYSLALLAFLPSTLAGSSGWISLVFGGGMVTGIGVTGFLIIAGLLLFRAYQVLRYPAALDARQPNLFGKFLRSAAYLAMLVGAAAGVGLFVVKPLTLLLFKSAGDAGIGYFVVGVVLVLAANLGWLGCLAFEVSRVCGPRIPAEIASKPWSKRRQDFAVLAVLLVLIIGSPFLVQQAVGKPCGEKNLARCVSTTEGGVHRIIALSHGEPVTLESAIEEIEMRYSGGRWKIAESPAVSLKVAGYPISPDANVRVQFAAIQTSEGVVLTLAVMEEAEETARFVTKFSKGASIEKTPANGIRVVVDLLANAKPGARSMRQDPMNSKQYALDQIFIQLRSAIGTHVEAREWPSRVVRPAIPVASTGEARPRPSEEWLSEGPVDSACKGRVESAVAKAVSFEGDIGWPLLDLTFADSKSPGPHALMSSGDRLVCPEGEAWVVSYPLRRPDLRIRRYASDGRLLHFVDTTVPPVELGNFEFDFVDPYSVRESGGRVRFERVITSTADGKRQEKKREIFEIVP